jgi:hypothetical protein
MGEKRIRLTVDFKMSFCKITPETVLQMYPSLDLRDVLRRFATFKDVGRQGWLLAALLGDEEVLRGFIACAVIKEVAAGNGTLLREALWADNVEEVLWPVIERLGGKDLEYSEEARVEGVFDEQLICCSTARRWNA